METTKKTKRGFVTLPKFIINQLVKKSEAIDRNDHVKKYVTKTDAYRVAELTSRYIEIAKTAKHYERDKIKSTSPCIQANDELRELISLTPELVDLELDGDPGANLAGKILRNGIEAADLLAENSSETFFCLSSSGYSVHDIIVIACTYNFYKSKNRRTKFQQEADGAIELMDELVKEFSLTGRFVFNSFTGASKKAKKERPNLDFLDNYKE